MTFSYNYAGRSVNNMTNLLAEIFEIVEGTETMGSGKIEVENHIFTISTDSYDLLQKVIEKTKYY